MVKLDHLSIFVSDHRRSRDWYATHFGFSVEFEVPERDTVALQDDAGLTLFLVKDPERARHPSCGLTFQVADVEATHRELAAAGVPFVNAPQKLFWGYGAELNDPDGYLIHLWDERTMREKSGA
jgi:catechol 2,3-dioxygenase-like lactoylglutathione lyase family enzyme